MAWERLWVVPLRGAISLLDRYIDLNMLILTSKISATPVALNVNFLALELNRDNGTMS